jgi:hypothetical protein
MAPASSSAQVEGDQPTSEDVIEPLDEELAEKEDEPGESGLEFDISPSYRVRTINVRPLDLSGEEVRNVDWTEQRFRLDAEISKPKVGGVHIQLDALDGVLFGDNGRFGQSPASNSGVSIASKQPNLAGWGIGLKPGGEPLDPDSYVPVLEERDLFGINYLYADVFLPLGLLRFGRQPMNYGATVSAHDGGRHNRWGVSEYSDGVDRILFGTKLDEAYRIMSGGSGGPDLSMDNGIIFALFYDLMKQESQPVLGGSLRQLGTSIQFLKREADWAGLDWTGLRFTANAVYLNDEQFNTDAFGIPLILEGGVENVDLTLQYIHLRGQTREISEGFAALTGGEGVDQQIRSHGAHAVLDVELGPVVLTLQGDYASGDPDPRPDNPITSFSFARDLNVGLLLFERIMAFESARSVAVGIENLSSADLRSFPLTEVRTEGRFTNALAFFPQAYVDWVRTPKHRFHTRAGVLFAWPASSGGVVDPIMTSLRLDGDELEDDAVNFHGGSPGNYYGTEFDLQVGYGFLETFNFILEGAMLVPGNSLQDEHGDAVNSYMMEARFEVAL